MKNTKIIHPIFFAAFPVISLFSHNIYELPSDSVLLPLVGAIAFSFIAWSVIDFFLGNKKKSAIIASAFMILFLSYGHFANFLPVFRVFDNAINRTYFTVLVGLLLVLFLLLRKINGAAIRRLTVILNIVGISLLVFPSLIIVDTYVSRQSHSTSRVSTVPEIKRQADNKMPDIYYIVVDSYASKYSLQEYYHFDNSQFTEALKKRGFYIAEASHANYPFTATSLASSLNMSYLDELVARVGSSSKDAFPLAEMTVNNEVVRYLKEKGYKYYYFGGLYPTDINADYNYIYPYERIALPPFTKLVVEKSGLTIVMPYININPFTKQPMTLEDIVRDDRLKKIRTVSQIVPDNGPKFVFVHSLLTHTPFLFDYKGYPVREGQRKGRTWNENYINQLQFANTVLLELIAEIQDEAETPPIIILQSDEGPYPRRFRENPSRFSWENATADELEEKTGILNAYYLPGVSQAELYSSISPVNTFRLVFNLYLDGNLDSLEDKNYVQVYKDYPYRLINVTNQLRKAN